MTIYRISSIVEIDTLCPSFIILSVQYQPSRSILFTLHSSKIYTPDALVFQYAYLMMSLENFLRQYLKLNKYDLQPINMIYQ